MMKKMFMLLPILSIAGCARHSLDRSAHDQSREAIRLVKEYPLGGNRHSLAEWLQYSFLTPAGKEEWNANPGETRGIYFVQYQASQDSVSSRRMESIVYVFRA